MARGWESKDVASQQELAEERKRDQQPAKSAAEVECASLELHRTRVVADLERARHPRHRAQLEDALRHLDDRLQLLRTVAAPAPVPQPDPTEDNQ